LGDLTKAIGRINES